MAVVDTTNAVRDLKVALLHQDPCSCTIKSRAQHLAFSANHAGALTEASLAGVQLSSYWLSIKTRLPSSFTEAFSIRLACAINDNSSNCVSIFPGSTVVAPSEGSQSVVDRGVLYLEQYRHLLSFTQGAPTIAEISSLKKVAVRKCGSVELNADWPWTRVDRPALHFISTESPMASSDEPAKLLSWLAAQCETLVVNEYPVVELIQAIRRAWGGDIDYEYGQDIVLAVEQFFNEQRNQLNRRNLLPVLFELEAAATFGSMLSRSKRTTSGIYAGNWIDVSDAEVAGLRGTELCENARLLVEVANLPLRGMAPLVTNEFGCVSDGNHRLTAMWIWNLLIFCRKEKWLLTDESFQKKVAEFVSSNFGSLSAVSLHECLHHLGVWLSNEALCRWLSGYFKRPVEQSDCISRAPIVFLPEHLSGAVVKEPYDEGVGVQRAHPSLYKHMSQDPLAVLPPRASYHFTDCALLPWVDVVQRFGSEHRLAGDFDNLFSCMRCGSIDISSLNSPVHT